MLARSLALLLALTALPAQAQTNEPARYQIISVSGGFIRLDAINGTMTFCRDEVDKFRCEPLVAGPDKAPAGAEAGATKKNDTAKNNTDTEDFDKALGMMEKAMKSFMAMTKENTPECAL